MIITGIKNVRSLLSTDDSDWYFQELAEIFPIESDVINPGKELLKKGLEMYKNLLITQIQDLNYTRVDPIFNENPKLFNKNIFISI